MGKVHPCRLNTLTLVLHEQSFGIKKGLHHVRIILKGVRIIIDYQQNVYSAYSLPVWGTIIYCTHYTSFSIGISSLTLCGIVFVGESSVTFAPLMADSLVDVRTK